MDVEALIAEAVAEARAAPRRGMLRWSEDEDEFLRTYLGILSEAEIAGQLGRSLYAVRMRRYVLGLPAPSKQPGLSTAFRAAEVLGLYAGALIRLAERGILPAHYMWTSKNRRTWMVWEADLERFVADPANHVYLYLDLERIADPKLRRLALAAAQEWDDRWLGLGQAAGELDCSIGGVHRAIRAGRLPAVRWANRWWVRESDASKWKEGDDG